MEGVRPFSSVNQNLQFDILIEQIPSKWKELTSELINSAINCYTNIRTIETTIESINLLEGLVPSNMRENISLSIVDEVLQKCANIKVNITNKVREFLCKTRLKVASKRKVRHWLWPFVASCEESYEQDFEKIWENERKELQDMLARERMDAANSFVKNQALVSGLLILVECYAIFKVWEDIQSAENVIETCKHDFPLIQDRLNSIQNDQAALRVMIEENILEDNSTLPGNIRALTFRLILQVNATRNMINELKVKVNGEIVTIAMQRGDTLRRGISNGAQAAGGMLTLFRLRSNLSAPYVWLQIGVTAAFTLISGENVRLYYICSAKLKELIEAIMVIQNMECLVAETEQVIHEAETYIKNADSTVDSKIFGMIILPTND